MAWARTSSISTSSSRELIRKRCDRWSKRLFKVYLNLKLGEVKFKELTYDLAEVIYEYPFRLPANFTYVMRALMTLEGIGIVTDPEFSFFETAKPYAKEFMLRREGKVFRKLIFDKLTGRENGEQPD